MRIFLPFKPKSIGGTSTFAVKFQSVMAQLGHSVSFDCPETYDLLFLIVQAPFVYLHAAKKRKVKVVQRLDGVYYWSIAKALFPLYNAKAALIRHLYSDYTIYQSHYSQKSCDQFLGPSTKPSSVITNGVDLDLFSPRGKKVDLRKNAQELVIFNASDFRYRHQIDPLLSAHASFVNKYGRPARLVLAGSFTGEVHGYPEKLAAYVGVTYLGPVKNSLLPQYERSSDLFVFSHINPPCPNNVIEAMACGLPICGLSDGSMPELCVPGSNSELLPVSSSGYWQEKFVDPDLFADNINKVARHLPAYSRSSRHLAQQNFDILAMGKKYERIFMEILNGRSN